MAKLNTITALDIGSHSIKLLTVIKKNGDENFEVLSQIKEPSYGVRKGVVIDVDKVGRIIQSLLDKARTESGQKISSVFLNLGGSHIFSTCSHGTVVVSRADSKVSEEDVDRVIQAAKTFSLPSNKEILEVFPKEFIVDGQGGIKEVIGMQGVRLETEILVLGGFQPYKNNLTQAVLDSDVQIMDIMPSPLASSKSVLSQQQKELGVALLDIGAGTTELAIFEEGDLVHMTVFPVGSANITNDIAVGLKTDIETAERIKVEKGSCLFRGRDKKEKIEVEGEEPLIYSHKVLSKIIDARVSEIFAEIRKELKKISKDVLPGGIVITGGGSKLTRITELAKKDLKLPCRVAKPSNFWGLEDDPSMAAVCGLVLQGSDSLGRDWNGSKFAAFGNSGIMAKVKSILKHFIP